VAVLTTDDLIRSVKRRALIPSDQVTFSIDDFREILNEELEMRVTKILLQAHEEYLVNICYYPLNDANLEATFRIPTRAIGNKLRGACFLNENGVITSLTRINPENLKFFQKIGYQTFSFYVQNDNLILTQSTVARNANWLRMYYFLKPSTLVENKYAAIIQSVDSLTGEIVVDKIPSTFASASTFEITQALPPNRLYRYDIPVASINNTAKTMTFNIADLKLATNPLSTESNKIALVPGDFITISGTSIVPQVPQELHPYLAQRAACACLEALGDAAGLTSAQAKLADMENALADFFDNRVEGSVEKINNFNSPLSQTRIRYRRSYW
jgi:hypothetical protein